MALDVGDFAIDPYGGLGEVADELARGGVGEIRFIGQLGDLADVVEEDSGQDEVAADFWIVAV